MKIVKLCFLCTILVSGCSEQQAANITYVNPFDISDGTQPEQEIVVVEKSEPPAIHYVRFNRLCHHCHN